MTARTPAPTPKDLGLRSDSFTADLPDDLQPRLILNIQGAQKVGKDDFAIRHTPHPIVIFNFDCGLEGVVEKHRQRGKHIIVAGVPVKSSKLGKEYPSYHFARPVPERGEGRKSSGYLERVKKQAHAIWERWISDMDEFYRSDARTGVIDTAGAAFALGKFAFHGMDKVTQKDDPYGQKGGELKALFQGIVTDAYSYDKNVLWLSRVKDEWKNGSPTGKQTNDGYKELPYEVQATLHLRKRLRRGEIERSAEVIEARFNTKFEGEVFDGDDYRFDVIAAALTNTDLKDWQ